MRLEKSFGGEDRLGKSFDGEVESGKIMVGEEEWWMVMFAAPFFFFNLIDNDYYTPTYLMTKGEKVHVSSNPSSDEYDSCDENIEELEATMIKKNLVKRPTLK